MNYKSIVQFLNFPDHYETRDEWEYVYATPTDTCYSIQDFANLVTEHGENIEELKLSSINLVNWYMAFKKGGLLKESFPGQVTIAEYTEEGL